MNGTTFGVCLVTLVAISGCSDSGANYKPVVVTPPASLPIVRAGCGSTRGSVEPAETDALPGGIWQGTVVDCVSNTSYPARALISEDGRFRIFGYEPDDYLFRGSLQTDGDMFFGYGLGFIGDGSVYLYVDGLISDLGFLDGRWELAWVSDGPSSLDALSGAWTSHISRFVDGELMTFDGVWTIEPDGRFEGQDARGCLQSGQFALIDEQYDLYELELTVLGCSLAGSYSGLATLEPGYSGAVPAMVVSVDDGAAHALTIYLEL